MICLSTGKEVFSMPERQTDTNTSRPRRRRLRGMLQGKNGRAIGLASLAVPLIGYAINDLRRHDSLIRGLLQRSMTRLLPSMRTNREVADISDSVRIEDMD